MALNGAELRRALLRRQRKKRLAECSEPSGSNIWLIPVGSLPVDRMDRAVHTTLSSYASSTFPEYTLFLPSQYIESTSRNITPRSFRGDRELSHTHYPGRRGWDHMVPKESLTRLT